MENAVIFDFEKLIVYQKSLDFTEKILTLSTKFHYHYQSSLGDQLRRASLSICNNIAEGSGKSAKAKIQFYQYALDSSRECIPMITICCRKNELDEAMATELRTQCTEITKMLYKLINSVTI